MHEAQAAWIAAAEHWEVPPHERCIEDDLDSDGILRLLVAKTGYLTNEEDVKQAFNAHDALKESGAPATDVASSAAGLHKLKKKVLMTQVLDEGSAAHVYAVTTAFVEKHSKEEPKDSAVRALLAE